MAVANKKDSELFLDYYSNDYVGHLLEWIIELLPQKDFDNNILLIKEDLKKPPINRIRY